MREILFRAERADSDTWIEGNLLAFDSRRYIINDTESIYYCPRCDREETRELWFAVIPETVGQYTGLMDKNGRKIFEGDIVSYNGTYHKVVFENRNGTGYFGIVVGENETWGFGNSTPAHMMTVVGNIHDNPDLLN